MLNTLEQAEQKQILIFALDEPRYALYLSAVERVVHAVETTALPTAPKFVVGVINMQGQVIPVLDIRSCFGIPAREINQDDQFILARTSKRLVALVVDSVIGIHELSAQELVTARQILPGTAYIDSLAKIKGDLVLLCDLEQFLSFEDEKKLMVALKSSSAKLLISKKRKASLPA